MIPNPYSGTTFFTFFTTLLSRIGSWLQGESMTLAADEVQMIVLAAMAASGALVGTFLVLRRMTMLANSLSHTILIGIVIAFFVTQNTWDHGQINVSVMLLASLITALGTTLLTHLLIRYGRVQEDASIGIVFTSLFALGIILVTLLTRDSHIGAEVVMGNVDALHVDDCQLALVVLGVNLLLLFCFFKEYKITTFDPGLSQALGISPFVFSTLLMVQTATTVVAAFRAVGVLMVLAFITGPVLLARQWTHDLKWLIILAVGVGAGSSLIGVALSRHLLTNHGFALSTGGLVVCLIALSFMFSTAAKSRVMA